MSLTTVGTQTVGVLLAIHFRMVLLAFCAINTFREEFALHLVSFLKVASGTGKDFTGFVDEKWFSFCLLHRTSVFGLLSFELIICLRAIQTIPLAQLFVDIVLVPVFELQEELCNYVRTAVLENVLYGSNELVFILIVIYECVKLDY